MPRPKSTSAPKTPKRPTVAVHTRLPVDTLAKLDTMAEFYNTDRSSLIQIAISRLLTTGLFVPKTPKASSLAKDPQPGTTDGAD